MIPTYLIDKYVHLCNFDKMKKTGQNYNFRCVICGDSKKSTRKTRGWILVKPDMVTYFCHNCNVDLSFKNFLRQYKPIIYNDFKKEYYLGNLKRKNVTPVITNSNSAFNKLKKRINKNKNKDILKKLSPLSQKAIEFCDKRKLPQSLIKTLYYTDNYSKFLKENKLGNIDYEVKSDKRIVIPFYNKDNNLTYLQGRALYNTDLRYVTTKIDENAPKIWGINNIDDGLVYVSEGVLDACFIKNGIAVAGGMSDIDIIIEKFTPNRLVWCFDRDIIHNTHIKKLAEKVINKKIKLFFWDEVKNNKIKDFNDLIMDGCSISSLNKMINRNIYSGLKAKIKLKLLRRR